MRRYRRNAVRIGAACLLAIASSACGAVDSARNEVVDAPSLSAIDTSPFNDALERAYRRTGSPGLAAAVIQDGVVVWNGEAGVADRATGKPVKPDTLFSLASVTKSYVAAMTLAIATERGIDLDRPIAGLVPRWVPGADEVTLRQLLGMTAGYRDVEADGGWVARTLRNPNYPWDRAHITRLLHRLRAPHFEPGSRYEYSNANYLLLGLALPTISGESVEASFQRTIRGPLGLADTHFAVDPAVIGRLAHGYEPAGRGPVKDTFRGARYGYPTDIWGTEWTDGGIEATATDVARFTDALYEGRLLDPVALEQMTTLGPGGEFGLGMYEESVRGHKWQGMDGYYGGFTSFAATDAKRHVTIVVLANGVTHGNSGDAFDAWVRLAAAYDG